MSLGDTLPRHIVVLQCGIDRQIVTEGGLGTILYVVII